MSEHDSDIGNFLSGFIIGGLVGAAAALLLAPQSGEETRAVLREKGIELKDRAVETAEETRMRAEAALEEARMRAEQAMEEVRVRAEEVARLTQERAGDLQEKGRSTLDQAISAGKRAAGAAKEELEKHSPSEDTASGELSSDPSI